MAEITALTALFTADLSQFEIGVGKATAIMSASSGRIGTDLAGIAAASIGMSAVVASSMNGMSASIQKVMGEVLALKNAMSSLGSVGGGAMKAQSEGSGTQIQNGTFVFNGVQDVNSLYDALADVSRQRS